MGKLSRFSVSQALNIPALSAVFRLLRKPTLILPFLKLPHLSDLDPAVLTDSGVKYVVLDKDNSITLPFKDDLHVSVIDTVRKLQVAFPGRVAILSNSIGSSDDVDHDHDNDNSIRPEAHLEHSPPSSNSSNTAGDMPRPHAFPQARRLELLLLLPVIRHGSKKPSEECMRQVVRHFELQRQRERESERKRKREALNGIVRADASAGVRGVGTGEGPRPAAEVNSSCVSYVSSVADHVAIGANATGGGERGESRARVLPHEICIIGDRLLTDILFANIYGMRGVLVGPISRSFWDDHPIAAVVRKVETLILLPIVAFFFKSPSSSLMRPSKR